MGVYQVELDDGRVFEVETEDAQNIQQQNVLGKTFNVPAAASRAAIRENPLLATLSPAMAGGLAISGVGGEKAQQAASQGALRPDEVPTFQEEFINKAQVSTSPIVNYILGTPASALGLAADIATSPADMALSAFGAVPAIQKAGGKIAATKGGQAVQNFLTKERVNPIRYMRNLVKTVKEGSAKKSLQLARKVRQELFQRKREIGDAFEEGMKKISQANPDTTIDLSPQLETIKSAIDDKVNNPGLAADLKSVIRRIKDPQKAKTLAELIDNPELAKNLTLQQAQDIKVAIQQAPSIKTKLAQGKFANYTPGDLELLDLIDEIKLAQSELFPEIADVRRPYSEYMSAYREVKNLFKPRSLETKLRKGFGTNEIEDMVKTVLPENIFGDIEKYRDALQLKGFLKKAAVGGGIAGGGVMVGRMTK